MSEQAKKHRLSNAAERYVLIKLNNDIVFKEDPLVSMQTAEECGC